MLLGIYLGKDTDKFLIEEALKVLNISKQDTFFLYSNINVYRPYPNASINIFHTLYDFAGKILFTSPHDYNEIGMLYNNDSYVCIPKEDLCRLSPQDKTLYDRITFIVKDNKGLRKIKNAELQSILR
jgi:hypothetical protein